MSALHIGEVTRTGPVSPGMVRVTFGGAGLAAFHTTGIGDEYVRIHFPDPSGTLHIPRVDDEGTWHYPDGVDPHIQPYTIRRHDPVSGEVDIDFVLHGHGRAAVWASRSRPGDRVAFGDPRGLYAPPTDARHQVFVTDATGLPAVARLLEQLPTEVAATAVVEIPEDSHRIPLQRPTGTVTVRWIAGRGNGVGPSAMTEALRALRLADDVHVWVAGESKALRDARRYLRHGRKLPAARFQVIGYWTDKAEAWISRWDALDESTRAGLQAIWDEHDDADQARDLYDQQLERLGL